MQKRRRAGKAVPALDRKPELVGHLAWVWNAFDQLSTCRMLGAMGVGPIPWVAIKQFALHHGITDRDEFERLRVLLCEMDTAFLRHMSRKVEQGK